MSFNNVYELQAFIAAKDEEIERLRTELVKAREALAEIAAARKRNCPPECTCVYDSIDESGLC